MSRWLAIAAYQCRINGVAVGSVDFRVGYFNLPEASDVEAALKNEPPQEYENELGEVVSWPLVQIFDIQGLLPTKSGDENHRVHCPARRVGGVGRHARLLAVCNVRFWPKADTGPFRPVGQGGATAFDPKRTFAGGLSHASL